MANTIEITNITASEKETIASLNKKIEDLLNAHNVLVSAYNELLLDFTEFKSKTEEKRGPKSSREMTEEDARRIILGDLKGLSHKAAAEKLGLSYGQVYSARGGYTFKDVIEEKNKQ